MTPSSIQFRRLVISHEALNETWGRTIWNKCRRNNVDTVERSAAGLQMFKDLTSGTLIVQVAPDRGWVTQAEHGILSTRPGEYYLNPIEGCRSKCSYCYLRSRPDGLSPLRLYVGIQHLYDAIDGVLARHPGPSEVLFCTGELADSLSDADLYPVGSLLAAWFRCKNNARLELRTKSDNVESLLGIDHGGRTTVSFSISPADHVELYERGVATLHARLSAARACQEAKYPIAVNFEPLILTPGWKVAYRELVESLSGYVDVSVLHHISVGCLRFGSALRTEKFFANRFTGLMANGAEFIEYRPGTLNGTFPRQLRIEAYTYIASILRKHNIDAPIWWSLEEPPVLAMLEGYYGRD